MSGDAINAMSQSTKSSGGSSIHMIPHTHHPVIAQQIGINHKPRLDKLAHIYSYGIRVRSQVITAAKANKPQTKKSTKNTRKANFIAL